MKVTPLNSVDDINSLSTRLKHEITHQVQRERTSAEIFLLRWWSRAEEGEMIDAESGSATRPNGADRHQHPIFISPP